MWVIVGFSVLVGILYLILVTIFIIGWKRINVFIPSKNEIVDTLISIVVPCRNEEQYISPLITSILQQSYQNFELILVNDHSNDATQRQIKIKQEEYNKIKLIDAVGFGKKNALKEGILKSKGDLILTTDADCLHSKHWLFSVVAFQNKYPSDLIICPVRFSYKTSLFAHLQKLEFASLVASGAGAAGAGVPILCNGANLVFTKDVWLKSQTSLHEEEQSGDDIFLLESIKKGGGVIRFLKSELAFAITDSSNSLKLFFKQRRRWASKSTLYSDWQLILTTCIIFAISMWEIVLFIFTFNNFRYLIPFFSVFIVKYILDVFFMTSVSGFFKLNNVWFYSLILSVVYPFYIVSVALSALINKPKNWK